MDRLVVKHNYILGGLGGTQMKITDYIISKLGNEHDDIYQEIIDKLGKFEDIMEKYGIKDVDELDERLEDIEHYAYNENREFIDIMAKYGIESVEELEQKVRDLQFEENMKILAVQQRDTWKKACELACRECDDIRGYSEIYDELTCSPYEKEYFYQQAQKEMQNESKS
ncbi:MAG: hypothetical protein ACI4PF_03795 [Christensenellales bacterium]